MLNYKHQFNTATLMGGDAFQGVQKLTNAQYQQITSQLIDRLRPYCQRIEPYIPLPEKDIHGDVDFLVILKEEFQAKDIIQQLKTQKFIENNNQTINSVYRNKQIDYFFVNSNKQFQLASFYKSYSGIGAYLGSLLPSNQIKLTTEGLYALGFHKHLKLQFLVSDQISQILEFYGLDYQRYKQGFKNREELFQFLRCVRFLDQEKFAYYQHKAPTKLIRYFAEFLRENGVNCHKCTQRYDNVLHQTLEHFKKKDSYDQQLSQLIQQKKRIKQLNQKFNATHLISYFKIEPKQVNQIKKIFHLTKFQNNEQQYYDYVQKHEIVQILKDYGQRCDLKVRGQKENI